MVSSQETEPLLTSAVTNGDLEPGQGENVRPSLPLSCVAHGCLLIDSLSQFRLHYESTVRLLWLLSFGCQL